MKTNKLKIALPKGRLLAETAALLQRAGWGLDGYHEQTRFYYIESKTSPRFSARVFHEKDIPIQVAIGNYDLGICGSDWIEELLAKYPSSALMKVKNLKYGEGTLYAASAGGKATVEALRTRAGTIRIASEYPNLAETFAINARLRHFSVFPLWGGAEVYPPESADLALVGVAADDFPFYQLEPISRVLGVSAFLIANRDSWKDKELSQMVAPIEQALMPEKAARKPEGEKRPPTRGARYPAPEADEEMVRLALPDGHQQAPTQKLLDKAGISLDDYPSEKGNRRPRADLEGVTIKVIRPQDMPLQVANDNFDLAITGRDWLTEHLCQFPSSPVKELLDLKLGRVKVVAVVSQDLDIADIRDLSESERALTLRVASEYINIADRYARDNRLNRYRLIPTWGATEAFLPEDADLLIENTQTGRTLAQHNLKIIDTLFESTACLIGSTRRVSSPAKKERMESITKTLRKAAEEI
jgi:ATP phosphoribosyltransferase